MTIIPPAAPPRHRCDVPGRPRLDADDTFHYARHYDPGTLWQCGDCRRWWYAVNVIPTLSRSVVWSQPYTRFRPVRWWHRAMRRRTRTYRWGGDLKANLIIPPRRIPTMP